MPKHLHQNCHFTKLTLQLENEFIQSLHACKGRAAVCLWELLIYPPDLEQAGCRRDKEEEGAAVPDETFCYHDKD